jgi:Ran GTPase-activating protein (RanGAP) involved in mRNA processing and transport
LPLLAEVKAFILHRLNVAGLKENIFNDKSIREIMHLSKEYPRLINIICDHALLTGYVREVKTIDEAIIKECENVRFLTGENDDNSKNVLKTTRGETPSAKAEPAITPIDYANRYNQPEERPDHLENNFKHVPAVQVQTASADITRQPTPNQRTHPIYRIFNPKECPRPRRLSRVGLLYWDAVSVNGQMVGRSEKA